MDRKQLTELARWGKVLRERGDTGEARAAGRAILMLVDEVERLQAGKPPRPPEEEREPPPADDDGEVGARRQTRALDRQRRRRRGQLRLAVGLAALLALGIGTFSAAARMARPDIEPGGPAADARIGAAAVGKLVFWVTGDPGTLEDTRWELDGADVTTSTRLAGDRLVYDGTKIRDGEHALTVAADGPFPGSGTEHEWRFAVDRTGPKIRLPNRGIEKYRPVSVSGTVESGATLRADGRRIEVEDGGRFTLSYRSVPTTPIRVVAEDGFGNRTIASVTLKLVPRHPPYQVRAVHVTADAWASDDLRAGVLKLLDEKRINAVELDLKDEAGIIGFDADVPFGKQIGAVKGIYDLADAVETLHAKGARVIGRLVAFRDPIHAAAAWRAGRRAEVVQTPGGGPYAGYGGFTNFANDRVQQYNIDVAKAAAEAGIDEVLYDYVRRPDGPLSSMTFPGLRGTPETAIVRFLHRTRQQLSTEVYLGASVFGVAATRPLEVSQDIPRMAREADYISPMLYPSHWGRGEYNVAWPNGQPYDIILRSLRDFITQTEGTGARIVPWLQDFTLGYTYGPAEVRAQIRAARDVGIGEFLLWDPLVTYTSDALDRTARRPAPQRSSTTGAVSPKKVNANELGLVPVIMYHQIRADGGGEFDLTPAEFRAELNQLYREGYRPVRAIDLVRGTMSVPAGTTPVVLTFDDSTKEQFFYLPNGKINPKTAIGILLDFARTHPGFKPTGTFYVNREPFAGVAEGPAMLRWLNRNGWEIGNHTHDHIPFNQKDDEGVQEALVRGKRIIEQAVPGARVTTMALPLGVMPEPASLALRGSWGGGSYRHEGVFLAGAEPAPSPFSEDFDPGEIPRIRTTPWHGEMDFTSGAWLRFLRQNPGRRYVSDGDPGKISFPRRLEGALAERFQPLANPY